uniref:Uncharacterized protein n=1 Tax=Cyanistes caeruleus TaxID=156563 RepID=A0A8C0V9J0_CYACU
MLRLLIRAKDGAASLSGRALMSDTDLCKESRGHHPPSVCVISKTIRVWLKRDSGQYWPSIYHTMASPCSAMAYHHDSRRIFVGQDNGAIMEFHISEDFNKMNFVKTYPAHQNRVSAITFCLASEWLISTGHDKCISWMCTRSGSMLGRHYFTSWASCLQYPLKNDCFPEAGRVLCSFTSICSQLFMYKN